MVADNRLERWLDACVSYHRDMALAHLDAPLGERRDIRLAEVIERAADACSAAELADLQRLIDETPEAQRAPLQQLRSWGLTMYLHGAILPYRRAMQAQQRSLTCRVDDELIPVVTSFATMAAESRRDRRAAIETAVTAQLGALEEHFEAQVEAVRHAASHLGYDSLDGWWNDVTGVDLAAQQDVVTELLEETQVAYLDLLTWAVQRRLRIPLAQLRRHDVLALFTMPDYQKYYQPGFLIPSLQACLQDMGIDPRADGRLLWREREAAFGPPDALAVQLPDEIVLSYTPVSGLQGAQAFAGACGQALLWAYTSADLPLLSRVLGDAALALGNAQWAADLVGHPLWLRRYARLTVDSDYASWRRLDRLYRFRRQLGRFLYTRHLYTSESLGDAAEAYRDIMMEACQVDYASAYYLADWDWQYTSLTFWRGWSLTYALLDGLQDQFAHDWFRNPECGQWLLQYWSEALAHPVDDVRQRLLGGAWEATHLSTALCGEHLG